MKQQDLNRGGGEGRLWKGEELKIRDGKLSRGAAHYWPRVFGAGSSEWPTNKEAQ